MNDLLQAFSDYIHAEGTEKNRLKQPFLEENAVGFLIPQLFHKDVLFCRAALSFLSQIAKKERGKQRILTSLPSGTLEELLASDDAKVRKNTAILMGNLQDRQYAGALCQALDCETQQYVLPSILLALGAIGGAQARQALKSYTLGDGQDVHAIAQRDAYQKACSKLFMHTPAEFTGFSQPHNVVLAPVSGLADSLMSEGKERGFSLKKVGGYAAVKTQDYAALFQMRCFYEALLPFGSLDALTPEQLVDAVRQQQLYSRLKTMHRCEGAFALRLEIRHAQIDRNAFASEFFSRVNPQEFSNAPSSYDIELRAVQKGNRTLLFIKLHTFQDPRFAYRQKTVPASIHPAAAAAVMYLLPHRSPQARILDPFCGSGTMLIERDFFLKTVKLHGVDIHGQAVEIAQNNARSIGLDLKCFHRSIVGFVPKEPYDEVISNMPFGNRVGTHDSNTPLYQAFFRQLPQYLRPGGTALLITNEKALLKSSAKNIPELKLIQEVPFSYGGLSPSAFLFEKTRQ